MYMSPNASPATFLPVAVCGIGCRFPGDVGDAAAFWSLLSEKRTGIGTIPADRWDADLFFNAETDSRGKMRTKWGGFLSTDVFGMDPAFFDMSPREVISMDPQQRLLLQVAYEAVQDAGMRLEDLRGQRTGVFVGMSTSDFGQRQQDGTRSDIFAGTGSAFSIASNRISHRFDLRGPSVTIDTACSSALVAIDQAVRNIAMGACDMALAGGVNIMLDPRPFIAFSSANMLSPTGQIYTFDQRANGFVRSEGSGLVLLKPLARALADGDQIYGVIRQTAVNQDGHTKTLTSPSGAAQEAMLHSLLSNAGVSPDRIGYVEAHGTGTPIGDPIESTAIGRALGRPAGRAEGRLLPVGSFKPNLGHLESASGIVGFIKTLLSVQRGTVLPNRNFETPNPSIPFDALGITVPQEARAYDSDPDLTRMGVVNSFGFGGTNASALIEEFRDTRPAPAVGRLASAFPDRPLVVPVSAGSKPAARLWAARLADDIENGPLGGLPVETISALLRNRDALAERAALVVEPTRASLTEALRHVAGATPFDKGTNAPAVLTGRSDSAPRVALAFSGQGGQWWAMSRRLLKEEPVYRRTVEMVDEALRPLNGWSTVEEMLRPEAESRINRADLTQASIFSNQIGLYEMWKEKGFRPSYLIGHSFGEVAATYTAGVIDLDTVARIITARGKIPHGSTRRGAMAAVGLTVEQLSPLLPADGSVVIAAFNGPVAQTISGMEAPLDAVLTEVRRLYPDALARRMTMDFGWHSEHLDDCEAAFRAELGHIACKDPNMPIISTVTGMFETRFDLNYWWANLRQPVSYTAAVNFCFTLGIDTFLEVGPHRTLTPLIRGIADEAGAKVTAINSLDRAADDFWTLARAEAVLLNRGVPLSRPARPAAGQAKLPLMPWANQHLSELPPNSRRFLFERPRHPLLGLRDQTPEPRWTGELMLANFKFLADHRVNSDCLFPAVGYIEMMGAALRDHSGDGPVELRDFAIHDALSIGADDIIQLMTEYSPDSGRLRISSLTRGDEAGWRLRAEAYGWRHDFDIDAPAPDLGMTDTPPAVAKNDFYQLALGFGLEYGPTFQPMQGVWRQGPNAILARLRNAAGTDVATGYHGFPGLFDGVLQACIALAALEAAEARKALADTDPAKADAPRVILPVGAKRIRLAAPLTDALWVETAVHSGEGTLDFAAYDDGHRPLLVIDGLATRTLETAATAESGTGEVYSERLEPFDVSEAPHAPASWLVIGDAAETAPALLAALGIAGCTVQTTGIAPFAAMDSAAADAVLSGFLQSAAHAPAFLFSNLGAAQALPNDADGAAVLQAAEALTRALVTLGKAIANLPEGKVRPRLAVLTVDARQIDQNPAAGIAGVVQSALVGLTRTLGNELQDTRVTQIDIDRAGLSAATALADLLLQSSPEPEFVLRDGTARRVRLEKKALPAVTPSRFDIDTATSDENFGITMSSPGVVDNILLREKEHPRPGKGEVVVEVAAVGLNFRDVMAATSILPDELEGDEAYWRNLGLEFAGRVVDVGEGVDRYRPGDRVMGMGKGYLRRFAKTSASTLMRVPDRITLQDAATLPVAYLTAHYALARLGRLEAGESVLVHLASGGVGLAAINVARHLGAEVLATAGTEAKRSHLRGLGIAHVMNSRGLDFARQTRDATGGRGVDVVLNALSGAGIDKSLEALAPFGRVVEIGKRDLAADKPIGLKSLYHNNSYCVVDLSTLPMLKPALFERLLAEVEALVAQGVYLPLTATRYPLTETAEAVRCLSRAQHIGKVIVDVAANPVVTVERDTARPIRFDRNASYLVTGGLKGFGAKIGNWLSEQGAGRVILANRSGQPDAATAALIRAMRARGTEVVTAALDVTDPASVRGVVAAHGTGERPLRGIFHAAAVIEDGFVTQLNAGMITRVLGPKVAGAVNLAQAATDAGLVLDHFTCFSSIAQLIGSPGQGNYTAANSVLNAFAEYRRARGLSGNSVAWGMIGGSGFVSRSEAMTNYLDSMGIRPVADADASAALGTLLRAESPYAAFAKVDWATITRAFPSVAANPKLASMLEASARGGSRIQSELTSRPRAEWEGILSTLIRTEVARVLKVDAAGIPVDQKLTELGLDSLSSFELKNRIEAKVEVSIPVARFLQAPTITGLSRLVASAFEVKLKLAEQKAAHDASSAGGAGQGGGSAELPVLGRQIEALSRPGLPMTSRLAAEDAVLTANATTTASAETLAERLALLCERHDALRLWLAPDALGTLRLTLGEAIAFADATPIRSDAAGPLWQATLSATTHGEQRLTLRAHRAAADAASLHAVLDQLAGTAAIPDAPPPLTAALRQLEAAEDSADRLACLAHWTETLQSAPAAVPVPDRARALAPVGLGLNRGTVELVTADLEDAARSLHPETAEAVALAAFGRALFLNLGPADLTVERHLANRDGALTYIVGPLASSLPALLFRLDRPADLVERVSANLARDNKWNGIDLAVIEATLGADLRAREVVPRQFGFALTQDPLTEDSFPVTANDLQMVVSHVGHDLRVQLTRDTAVFSDEQAHAILESFAAELADLGSPKPRRLSIRSRSAREETAPAARNAAPLVAPSAATGSAEMELPLTVNQSTILSAIAHPMATPGFRSSWMISSAFAVRPQFDLARLGPSLAQLVARHEAMRTRFTVADDGTMRAFLRPNAPPPLTVEEAASFDMAEHLATKIAVAEIDPFTDDLFQVHVIRVGTEGDVLVAKGHHAVFDGYSLGLMVEEMVMAYLGLSLPQVGLTTLDFIKRFELSQDAEALARRGAEMERLFAKPAFKTPKIYLPGKEKTAGLLGHRGSEIVSTFSQDQSELLKSYASSQGATVSALTSAALANALCTIGDAPEVMLFQPVSMRVGNELTNYVNWVASDAFSRLSADMTLLEAARQVQSDTTAQLNSAPMFGLRHRMSADGQYDERSLLTERYMSGMLTHTKWAHGTISAQLQRLDTSFEEIDLGIFKVRQLRLQRPNVSTVHVQVRSFETEHGFGLRTVYASDLIAGSTAQAIRDSIFESLASLMAQA